MGLTSSNSLTWSVRMDQADTLILMIVLMTVSFEHDVYVGGDYEYITVTIKIKVKRRGV